MSDLGAGWLVVALALLLALVLALIGMLWFVRGRRDRSGRMPAPHGRPQRSPGNQARVDVPAGRDRYRIERQIGQGAMSTVHLAHDLFLDRPVALKTLSLSAAMDGEALDQARSRFAREAVTAGFGQDAAGEDRLDCVLGLLCMIQVLDGIRPDHIPDDPWVRRWEGWVLGQAGS